MKLKELVEQYGEYEVDSKCVVGECEIERIVIDLTKPKPKTVWELKKGDRFAWVDSLGAIDFSGVEWEESESDRQARAVGNVFLGLEEALQDIERRKVEALLLKHGGRRWLDHIRMNYFIEYDRKANKLDGVCTGRFLWQGLIYFDTQEQVKNAIEQIGEQRIINALFEVR